MTALQAINEIDICYSFFLFLFLIWHVYFGGETSWSVTSGLNFCQRPTTPRTGGNIIDLISFNYPIELTKKRPFENTEREYK